MPSTLDFSFQSRWDPDYLGVNFDSEKLWLRTLMQVQGPQNYECKASISWTCIPIVVTSKSQVLPTALRSQGMAVVHLTAMLSLVASPLIVYSVATSSSFLNLFVGEIWLIKVFFFWAGIFVYSSSLDHHLPPWTPRRPTWSMILFINIFVFLPFLVITINITIIITINITIIITIIIMPCSKACGFLRLLAALFLTQLRTWRILQGTPCLSSLSFSLKGMEYLYFLSFLAAIARCSLQRNSF